MTQKQEVAIGTPGYYSIGSDTYPVTCIAKTSRGYTIQYDKFTGDKENGHDYFGRQVWKFERNENGRTEEITWRPSRGRYQPKGRGVGAVFFGKWYAHQDPSF